MQIPSIRGFFTSETPDYMESSWKGRAMQVLCVVSFLALIYYVAFRHKKTDNTSSQDCSSLEGRASQNVEPSVEQDRPSKDPMNLEGKTSMPETALLDHGIDPSPRNNRKNCFEIRVTAFTVWLAEKLKACNTLINDLQLSSGSVDWQAEIHEIKAQLTIMIPIFQAHPEAQTADWDAFLKECDAVAAGEDNLLERCVNLRSCFSQLRVWSIGLRRHLAKKAAEEPAFWDLYHFGRLLGASSMTCDRITGDKERALLNPALATLDRLTDTKKRSFFKPTLYRNALRVFIPELEIQVEKMAPVFQTSPNSRRWLSHFFQACNKFVDSKVSEHRCRYFKTMLTFLEVRSASLLNRYGITKSLKGPDFTKAFLKYFKVWLPEKIESCDYVTSVSSGSTLQSAVCSKVLKTFVAELKEQAEKMVLVFQSYSEIKTEDLAAFITDCDKVEDDKNPESLKESCLALRGGLEKLQSWSASLENT